MTRSVVGQNRERVSHRVHTDQIHLAIGVYIRCVYGGRTLTRRHVRGSREAAGTAVG